ncbi:hypothetical protein HN51_069652, partial [Arachis hypogaea]
DSEEHSATPPPSTPGVSAVVAIFVFSSQRSILLLALSCSPCVTLLSSPCLCWQLCPPRRRECVYLAVFSSQVISVSLLGHHLR